MTATFAEWLLWPDRAVVVLAELEPSLELDGWTPVGVSAPDTYVIALPRAILTAGLAGGVSQRCSGVRQNATVLTLQADIADVDANAGSWFWDEAAELLYVHTTTGSDPDSFTIMQAFVTLYVATKGVVLNRVDGDADTGIYYQPWLDVTIPTITREVEDIFFGQKNIATGNIRLLNATGLLDTILAPDGAYSWKNKKVRFFLGGSFNGLTLPRSEYADITTMLVEDVASDDSYATFELKPVARRCTVDIPKTPYFESSYPNLGEGVAGTKKWIGYGRTIMRPDLTDTTSYGVYTIADAAFQTLFAVDAVWAVSKTTGARTLLTVTSEYTVDLTACTVTVVDATYTHVDWVLEVDVTGKPNGSGGYLRTFGEIVVDLLTTFAGVTADDIDQAAFDQADIDAPVDLAVWLKSPRALSSIISTSQEGFASLERSVMGTVQETLAGKFTGWIWDPSYTPGSITTLTDSDFVEFKPLPKLETIVGEMRVKCAPNQATGACRTERHIDTRTQYKNETDDGLELLTFLANPTNAQTLAQRYALISGSVSTEIEFTLRRPLLAQHIAGDKVLVTTARAPSVAGAYDQQVFELVKLGKSFSPTVAISGRLGDLRGVGSVIGHWMDSGAPDYAAATAAERSTSGFWSDSDGLIDPLDGLTRNRSVWW